MQVMIGTTSLSSSPLDALPLWALMLVASLVLLGAVELGYRIGKLRHAYRPDERDQPVGAMVGSILALLALVLGFTFSLAATRFEARRQTVLEEANAIGTTYLRASLLPEPERVETEKLLRMYVQQRIQGATAANTAAAIEQSVGLHELLWAQAKSAADKQPNSIMVGVFVQSLNELIDLHAQRIMVGLRSRIPLVIWSGLYGLALLGMTSVGYQAALTTTRRSPVMLVLVLAFSVVLLLIADLDRGQEGLLRVSQQALIDVQNSMNPAPPNEPADEAAL
jgi:hypothetical protein